MKRSMRACAFLCALLLLLSAAGCARGQEADDVAWRRNVRAVSPTETAEQTAAPAPQGLTDFSARLAGVLLAGDGNAAFSPLCIWLALGMLTECAQGPAREELLALLGAEDADDLGQQARLLQLSARRESEDVKSSLGASLWLQDEKDVNYSRRVMDRLAETYLADTFWGAMGSDAYNQALRDWIDERTGGLLTEQLAGLGLPEDTVAALVTTVYLKAGWRDRFSSGQTAADLFHAPDGDREAAFMHQTLSGQSFWRGEGYTAVSRPLQEGFTMWLMLPEEGRTPADLLADPGALSFLVSQQDETVQRKVCKVVYTIPRFDAETAGLDLIPALRELGLSAVFWGFDSPLCPELPLQVGKILHGARVKADEEGVEAAAYTAVMARTTNAQIQPPEETEYFTADRPFLFCITQPGGGVMFLGVVNAP